MVYGLIDKHSENKEVYKTETDNDCDSLIVAVEELMQSSSEKDSLYEHTLINMQDQLKNKDFTITLKDKQYAEIKSAFEKTIEGNDVLTVQNRSLAKQAKRYKVKSKVLSAALLLLTGAATNYIIHH